jgi:hypothetical protein
MTRVLKTMLPILAAAILLVPQSVYAQVGSISGVVRDDSQAVLPGVTVEVTSPALIEKVRSTSSDGNGRYQITALPVGTYEVTFTLSGFSPVRRQGILVTSNAAASVNADLRVGGITDEVTVTAESPMVDVVNAHQQTVFSGDEIADLPTQRDIPSILNLVPGISSSNLRGTCSGGVGGFCNPTVPLFNAHTAPTDAAGQNQGRIMVDGMSINMGRITPAGGIDENVGQANGIVLNTAGAQEVSFTLSGALGESETGGTSINLVPRTGGNRYSGSYSTTYTENRFFDRNRDTRLTWSPGAGTTTSLPRNNFVMDYDITGAFGGPVVRDRLWFYLQGRMQNRETYPGGQEGGFRNLNEGVFAANWLPDRDPDACARVSKACGENGAFTYINEYKNASARLTLQATQKNKFNIYWDEQDACTNPCYGMISVTNSNESYFTLQNRPNRLLQLSWTNPYTNRVLLEAGLTTVLTHQDQTKAREFTNPSSVPRICEAGTTIGRDAVSLRMHSNNIGSDDDHAGGGGAGLCGIFTTHNSGSINDQFPGGTNTLINDDTYRSRASLSYITGSHNMKVGFEGAYFMEKLRNEVNALRMNYRYQTPNTTATTWNAATRSGNCLMGVAGGDEFACGNMSLPIAQGWHNGSDLGNVDALRPIPFGFDYNTGVGNLDERVWFGAFYLQDQWTVNRFTINGALRYDHAESRYGASCVGPDLFVPNDAGQPTGSWCSEPSTGVRYNDITPRWGMAWDVFGTGKTSVKFNGGKFVQSAGFGGLYTGFNDARRSTNSLTRRWDDTNGNRLPDCDATQWQEHSTGGDYCGALSTTTGGVVGPSSAFLQFGRPPGASALANPNSSCGLKNSPQLHVDYCLQAQQDLMRGWNTRRNEWQLGWGIQHEVLPRLSAELTYNYRKYGNITVTDAVNRGCDFHGTRAETFGPDVCLDAWQNFEDPNGLWDFYSFTVPEDPRLPDGGGYTIRGLTNNRFNGALPATGGNVTLVREERGYYWHGFDTNFVYRGPRGFRLSGGTSTGKDVDNTCSTSIDSPNVRARVGNELGNCRATSPFRTNVRANASYTIPFVDVLTGVIFSYRPGQMRTATMNVHYSWIDWEAGSQDRLNRGEGRFTAGNANAANAPATDFVAVPLLDSFDIVGEGMRMTDLTFRKNFRFAGKRLTAGVDVYNLFNTDAATGYNNTFSMIKDANGDWVPGQLGANNNGINDWNRITAITSPRFMRFNVTFDF